jgi:RimJ/RimL family protein N-acetyltransferase
MICIEGKNINLRLIQIEDAEFILSLRMNLQLSKYLSRVEDNIALQREWIKNSLKKSNERYFIIENKEKEKSGTVRIYNVENGEFSWGSWIVKPEHRKYSTFESAYLSYKYAFTDLGLNLAKLDARNGNLVAINFYKRFGAKIINTDEIDTFFYYTKEDFLSRQDGYEATIEELYRLKNGL